MNMKKLLILLTLACATLQLAAAKPNILVILVDDLGITDLGCYGATDLKSPNIDRLAGEGMRFGNFYANCPVCSPSRASLMTGRFPDVVGVPGVIRSHPENSWGYLDPNAVTLPQILKQARYRTGMVGKWHLGLQSPNRPNERGFEWFKGFLGDMMDDYYNHRRHGTNYMYHNEREIDPKGHATDLFTDWAAEYIRSAPSDSQGKPWFLYLAYNAPHFPLHAPKEEIAKYAKRYHGGWDELREARLARMKTLGIVPDHTQLSPRSHWRNYGETKTGVNPAWNTLPEDRRLDLARRMAIYAAMIDRLDQQISRVVADLKRAGEFENTLIVFTSDNGACFEWDPFGFDIVSSNQNILHRGEMLDQMGSPGTFHSLGSGWANAANTPWRLYKHFNHEGGIASPGIVHWPAGLKVTPGSILHQPAHLIDLLPSAIAAARTRYEGKLPLPGVDLVNQLHGKGDERTLFFEHQGNRAVRRGDWKLVALDDEPWELYDFTRDRTEMNDLSGKYPGLVKEFADAWEKWAEANHVTPLPRDLGVAYLKPD